MFKKIKLKRKITACKRAIIDLEKKRARSQAALVEAILTNTVPKDEDVDYFNRFTSKINDIRTQMQKYRTELDEMKKMK